MIKNKKIIFALALLMLFAFALAVPAKVYATEGDSAEGAVTLMEGTETTAEEQADGTEAEEAEGSDAAAEESSGLANLSAADEEDDSNLMEDLLSIDRKLLHIFAVVMKRLAAILAVLVGLTIVVWIYMLVVKGVKLSAKTKKLEKQVSAKPVTARKPTGNAAAKASAAKTGGNKAVVRPASARPVTRPAAPQRPVRTVQPNQAVRQPVRPVNLNVNQAQGNTNNGLSQPRRPDNQ